MSKDVVHDELGEAALCVAVAQRSVFPLDDAVDTMCTRSLRDLVHDRFGGADVFRTVLSGAMGSHDEALALSNRFFEALGCRDVIIRGRRYVQLRDGDDDLDSKTVFLFVDRRAYEPCLKTLVPHFVTCYVCENGHTFVRPRDESEQVVRRTLKFAWLPSAKTIGVRAFYGSSLTSLVLPVAQKIGPLAFYGSPLRSISLPATETISDSAFWNCFSLGVLSFPAVTRVGKHAFIGCSNLTSISLPALASFGDDPFYGCYRLRTVQVSSTLPSRDHDDLINNADYASVVVM